MKRGEVWGRARARDFHIPGKLASGRGCLRERLPQAEVASGRGSLRQRLSQEEVASGRGCLRRMGGNTRE